MFFLACHNIISPVAIGRRNIQYRVTIHDIAEIIGRFHDGFPNLLIHIEPHQDTHITAIPHTVSYLEERITYRMDY